MKKILMTLAVAAMSTGFVASAHAFSFLEQPGADFEHQTYEEAFPNPHVAWAYRNQGENQREVTFTDAFGFTATVTLEDHYWSDFDYRDNTRHQSRHYYTVETGRTYTGLLGIELSQEEIDATRVASSHGAKSI